MIGPCPLDPEPDKVPDWLASIKGPIVLVTTSSEKQGDDNLIQTALAALADEPVHLVATVPAGGPDDFATTSNATVCQLIPHGVVLDRAVCAVTHGGMGARKKPWPVEFPCASCRSGATSSRSHGASRWPGAALACRQRRTVSGAPAHKGARSDDHDRRSATGGSGFRRHRRRPRRRPLRAARAQC